ncbi:MAG TPA: hypothetical protein VK150_02525, partial [Geothrix sp.]|nr:hypothetical protein [Geothrix sp.]
GKHWDPKNWVGAVVENLAGAPGAYHVVRGGCFQGSNHQVTHWFGGGIGLEDAGFRRAAAERIRALGPSGRGAWVFWLEPQGAGLPSPEELASRPAASPARFSIRHPMLHRMLRRQTPPAARGAFIGSLTAEAAVAALSRVARILADYQGQLHRARAEPAHDRWSEQALDPVATVAGALALAEGAAPAAPAPKPMEAALEAAIRDLYQTQGEALRTLESAFDETSGYAAWDAPRNPLRELLSDYLAEDAETRAQV